MVLWKESNDARRFTSVEIRRAEHKSDVLINIETFTRTLVAPKIIIKSISHCVLIYHYALRRILIFYRHDDVGLLGIAVPEVPYPRNIK